METTKLSAKVGVLLRPKSGKRTGRIADLAGMLKRPGRKPVPLEAMDAAVAAATKSRHARGRY